MAKVMTIKFDVLKCECGNIIMKKPNKVYYTCEECGTTMSRTGRILVKGNKLAKN